MIIFHGVLSKMKLYLLLPFYVFRYLLHILFFYYSDKKRILQKELLYELQSYKMDKIIFYKNSNMNIFMGLLWAFHYDPFFLSLFYYRIGQSRSFLCSFFKKDTSTLIICCEDMGKTKMYHPFATIINAKKIGNNFTFRNNTTIGNIHDDYMKRPIIGDNVTLGANVVIFGDITIGNNVIIGAGTVVNKDVPDNCIIVGNPFRIIYRK